MGLIDDPCVHCTRRHPKPAIPARQHLGLFTTAARRTRPVPSDVAEDLDGRAERIEPFGEILIPAVDHIDVA